MAARLARCLLAVALLWTEAHICLMPQAECEAKSSPSCCCRHGQGRHSRCCTGVHLTEAGTDCGAGLRASAQTARAAAGPVDAPEPSEELGRQGLPICAVPSPRHPPPRESLGRSPPASA